MDERRPHDFLDVFFIRCILRGFFSMRSKKFEPLRDFFSTMEMKFIVHSL